ncbi:MAG: prolipoprotein diacylglyceryl transferase family protein [Thermoanaerobaculia bacterium]
MLENFVDIGPLTLSPFGIAMAGAFLFAYAILRWGFQWLDVGDTEDASAIVLGAGLGGIAGAKIYYAILYSDWRLLFDRFGLVWYGGFIGGAGAVLWVIRRRRLVSWKAVDAATPALAIGYAIGRIGCFLVGDDYGMPTALPWGVKFPFGLPGPTTAGFMRREYGAQVPFDVPAETLIPVHPTQLYETAAALFIGVLGLMMVRRRVAAGTTSMVVLSLLAFERFGVEFLRAKDDRMLGSITLAQVLSLAVVAVLWFLWWRYRPAIDSRSDL